MAPGGDLRSTWRSTSLTGPHSPVRKPLPIPCADIAGCIMKYTKQLNTMDHIKYQEDPNGQHAHGHKYIKY